MPFTPPTHQAQFSDLTQQIATLHQQYFNRLKSILLAGPVNAYLFGVDETLSEGDEDDDHDDDDYFDVDETPTTKNSLDRDYRDVKTELTISLAIYRDGIDGFAGPVILAFTTDNKHKRLEQFSLVELQRLVWQLDNAYTGETRLILTQVRKEDKRPVHTVIRSETYPSVDLAFRKREALIEEFREEGFRTGEKQGLLTVELKEKDIPRPSGPDWIVTDPAFLERFMDHLAKDYYLIRIEPTQGLVAMEIYDELPNFNPVEVEYLAGTENLNAIKGLSNRLLN